MVASFSKKNNTNGIVISTDAVEDKDEAIFCATNVATSTAFELSWEIFRLLFIYSITT